jgi:hypothetical protein
MIVYSLLRQLYRLREERSKRAIAATKAQANYTQMAQLEHTLTATIPSGGYLSRKPVNSFSSLSRPTPSFPYTGVCLCLWLTECVIIG